MPNSVLTQLKALRDGVAQELRMDPRYRTLQALDKSIAEITSVLSSAGLLPAAAPSSSLTSRLSGLGPSVDALAEPSLSLGEASSTVTMQPTPVKPTVAAAPVVPKADESHPAASPTPGFKDGTAGASKPVVPEKKASVLKPAVGIAAALLVAGGVAAEVAHEHAKHEAAKHPEAEEHQKAEEHDAAGPEHEAAEDHAAEEHQESEEHEGEEHEPVAKAGAAHEKPDAEDHRASDIEEEGAEEAEGESESHPTEHAGKAAVHAPHAHEDEEAEAHPGRAGDESEPNEPEAVHDHAAKALKHPQADDGGEPQGGEADADEIESGETDEHGAETHGSDDHAGGDKAGTDPAAEDGSAVIPKGKASGYVPMAAKAGAPKYAPSIAVKFGKLPNKVDLRPLMTPIEDQGQTSSCVANAVAGAYEYWIKKASKKNQTISRLFVYYNARWRDGSQDKDEGSVIQLAMEGLQKFGACSETVWPFDPRIILKKPGATAYQDGAPYRVHDMAQVPLKLEAWKQALAEGKPIIFGIELFDSFDTCTKRGGVVPMPAPNDLARKKHSGHSMCAVGYNESEKVFIIRNSWGTDFGDKGYCYMPYDYILSSKFNDGDCWVFVPKVPSQPPRETWQDTTTPVTNGGEGVDFIIQPYRIEDYERIAIDLFEHARRPWNATIVAEYSEYVSAVSKSLFTELETFDVKTFLETTAILAGVGVTAEYLSESSSSESSSFSSSESSETTSLMSSESTSESEDSEATDEESEEDEAGTEAEAAEAADEDATDDDAEDKDAEGDAADDSETDAEGEDADSGEDDAEGKDETGEDGAKDDATEDEAGEDEGAEDDAGEDDADEDDAGEDEADEDEAGEDEAGEDEAETDDAEEDEAGEDEAGEDEAEDDAGDDADDGGGDDGGGDDGGGGDDE